MLHGATGFSGRLVARYLAQHPEGSRFTWAIAGRNADKLDRVRATVAAKGAEPGVIVAQAADEAFVAAMVAEAKVVLNVAGPFSEYHADHIVAACAQSGTHYADLSGEYWFQRRMIDECHADAERACAKVVLAAGVDSIPSDLGAQLAVSRLAEKGGRAAHVKALFTSYTVAFIARTVYEDRLLRHELGGYEAYGAQTRYRLLPGVW